MDCVPVAATCIAFAPTAPAWRVVDEPAGVTIVKPLLPAAFNAIGAWKEFELVDKLVAPLLNKFRVVVVITTPPKVLNATGKVVGVAPMLTLPPSPVLMETALLKERALGVDKVNVLALAEDPSDSNVKVCVPVASTCMAFAAAKLDVILVTVPAGVMTVSPLPTALSVTAPRARKEELFKMDSDEAVIDSELSVLSCGPENVTELPLETLTFTGAPFKRIAPPVNVRLPPGLEI